MSRIRPADRNAGIQRVDPRRAEERDRLGVAPVSGELPRRLPAAVVGASTGPFGAVWAQAELRKVLKTVGAPVVDLDLPVAGAHDAFTPTGRLRDAESAAALELIVHRLLEQTLERAA